jgi:hypothetical protein
MTKEDDALLRQERIHQEDDGVGESTARV